MTPGNKTDDAYAADAAAYDVFDAPTRAARTAALETLLPLLRLDAGPVLDVGAGSGSGLAMILERLPEARVLALEPSAAMRSLALARVAARPEWFARATIRPEDFFSATLPASLGGALLLGVIGHFDPDERVAVLAELADRLVPGGVALLDLRMPERPRRVPAFEYARARIGDLSYRGITEAWPLDLERMRWRTSYLTLEDERILVEDTSEHEYRHPAPAVLADEASRLGLRPNRLGGRGFWTLTRVI